MQSEHLFQLPFTGTVNTVRLFCSSGSSKVMPNNDDAETNLRFE
jgi:hypothetical protein